MRHRKQIWSWQLFPALILIVLSLAGCGSSVSPVTKCTVLFEDNDSLYFPKQIYEVSASDDLEVTLGLPHGYQISSVNYEDYSLSGKISESFSYDYYTLTLHHIRYSALIRLEIDLARTTTYHDAAGSILTVVTENGPHLRPNTLSYEDVESISLSESKSVPESEEALPIGWNTSPDGTGTHIGFGSRVDHSYTQNLLLYPDTLKTTASSAFTYTVSETGELTITGYQKTLNTETGDLVLPAFIDGYPVTGISENAFPDLTLKRLAFPPTLNTISSNAFGKVTVTDFYFYDTISDFPEDAFEAYCINYLHLNAATDPVYSGSYFDTLSDKVDYLYSLRDKQKLVLFCGSSARFGYDSSLLEAAFPDYKVVNMGVYAYSNMLPQAGLLQLYMKAGDVLLSSPELDAIGAQFCGETDLDKETFCMLESNYDMLSLLDCRDFTNIFTAYTLYNNSRQGMESRSYQDSPSYYDEDGNLLSAFSYNGYGDYILFRENNEERINFGVKRAYYNVSYIREQDLQGLNAVYDDLTAQGIRVLFTYSPRSSTSISSDSTAGSIRTLESFLQEQLHATIISPIEDSLMDPYYFHGTDNHLSTEGVAVHTADIIQKLKPFMEEQP